MVVLLFVRNGNNVAADPLCVRSRLLPALLTAQLRLEAQKMSLRKGASLSSVALSKEHGEETLKDPKHET